MLPLDVSVLQADCATWTCLFNSRQSLFWNVCYKAICVALRFGRVCSMSVHAFAVLGGVWPTAACAAPGRVCLQEHVLHLCIKELCRACAAPARVTLCCSWTRALCCSCTCAFVLLLYVCLCAALYVCLCAAPGRVPLCCS